MKEKVNGHRNTSDDTAINGSIPLSVHTLLRKIREVKEFVLC